MTAFMMMMMVSMSSDAVDEGKAKAKAKASSVGKAREVSLVREDLVEESVALEVFADSEEVASASDLDGVVSLLGKDLARVAKACLVEKVVRVNLVWARAKESLCYGGKEKARARAKVLAISVVLRITGKASVP